VRRVVQREFQDFAYGHRNRKLEEWWDGFLLMAKGEEQNFGYDAATIFTPGHKMALGPIIGPSYWEPIKDRLIDQCWSSLNFKDAAGNSLVNDGSQ